jgi:hypothetical protein
MGEVVKFERIKRADSMILLTYDPRELVDVSEADALVSWNIDSMGMDELRYNLRCMILLDRNQVMLNLREKGKLQKRIEELEGLIKIENAD